jgi:hypothetical protein
MRCKINCSAFAGGYEGRDVLLRGFPDLRLLVALLSP